MPKPEFKVDKEKLQIIMTHTFDAPREVVWKAHTDPKLIPQWWGPRNLTTIVEKMDFTVGGKWRFVQTEADGKSYAFFGEYKEINPPSKAVQTFEFEPLAGHVIIETMTLEEVNGKTKMMNVSQFANLEDLEGMVQSGMESGAVEGVERMGELLENLK